MWCSKVAKPAWSPAGKYTGYIVGLFKKKNPSSAHICFSLRDMRTPKADNEALSSGLASPKPLSTHWLSILTCPLAPFHPLSVMCMDQRQRMKRSKAVTPAPSPCTHAACQLWLLYYPHPLALPLYLCDVRALTVYNEALWSSHASRLYDGKMHFHWCEGRHFNRGFRGAHAPKWVAGLQKSGKLKC